MTVGRRICASLYVCVEAPLGGAMRPQQRCHHSQVSTIGAAEDRRQPNSIQAVHTCLLRRQPAYPRTLAGDGMHGRVDLESAVVPDSRRCQMASWSRTLSVTTQQASGSGPNSVWQLPYRGTKEGVRNTDPQYIRQYIKPRGFNHLQPVVFPSG